MGKIKKFYFYAVVKYMDDNGEDHIEITLPRNTRLEVDKETDCLIDRLTYNGFHIYKITFEEAYEFTD